MGKYGKDWCACGDYLIGTPHECKFNQSTSERIGQVQADLFAIREDLRDTLDDAKDARFIRLAAELGILAEEFILPEESVSIVIDGPPYFKDNEPCGYCHRPIGTKHANSCRQ